MLAVRHITAIRVGNLTPFPARDAFATALSQPSEQPQFSSHGHFSDDLDLTISRRRRSRRISLNSVSTRQSDELVFEDVDHTTRKRTTSRVSLGALRSSTSSQPLRPTKIRTSSITSINSSVTAPFSAALPNYSQAALERVIQSRLVETFVSITVPSSTPATDNASSSSPRISNSNTLHLESGDHVFSPIPDYLSPVHPPSTNPIFQLDSKSDFPEWTDRSSERLKVELWAKVEAVNLQRKPPTFKGKEKESAGELDWKVLNQWSVDLPLLVPVSEEVSISQLPSNTLVITLGQQDYFMPPPSSRPESPSNEHISDPENNESKVRQSVSASTRRRKRGWVGMDRNSANDLTPTASWQDLFKLVTLQSCVLDNKSSSNEIIRRIDKTLTNDAGFTLRRQASELEARVDEIHQQCDQVRNKCKRLDDDVHLRRELLRQRKEMLTLAKRQENELLRVSTELAQATTEERKRLGMLRGKLRPTRTTLLSTLAFIFPIELVSPPDLLFTILDVPLPIPLSPNDPAPPLSLPMHKEVTEDSVASSLGYAAQLVQLLAAYLGKGLTYPVTCIASRSLIRDGISAMVGPRMFPLFSRGVDTYRFEYAVFLLNKNIELLMGDEDLRALDMRHTLPNLKNLLLTLTSGEAAPLGTRPLDSPTLSGLESPRSQSPEATPATPKASNAEVSLTTDSTTPPPSGSTTPTGDTVKKTRPFLGLSFPSSFLRPRLGARNALDNDVVENGTADDHVEVEDDRQTIRGEDQNAVTKVPTDEALEKTNDSRRRLVIPVVGPVNYLTNM